MKEQVIRLGKDSIIYGMGSVVSRFIGLLMLPIFTKYLKPEEYGTIAMLALLTTAAYPVFSLGLGAAMGPSYYEGNSPQNMSKAVWTTFCLSLISASILVIVAWVFPDFLGGLVGLPTKHAHLIGITLTGCSLTIISAANSQQVQFEKRAGLYVVVTLTTAIISIVVSLVTVVNLGWGVDGMVLGQFCGSAVGFVVFLVIGLRSAKPTVSHAMAKELLRTGLPLIPGFASLFIIMNSGRYILEKYAGLNAVGVYSVGFSLGMTISIVTSGIATAWYPFFMTYIERQSEARVTFGKIFTYVNLAVGYICLCYFIFSRPLVQILTPPDYYQAASVVGLAALGNYFQLIFYLFLPGLYYNKQVKYISIIQGIAAVLSLLINYSLVRHIGVVGAGVGLVVANGLMASLLLGWNYINRSKYPAIDYEWKKIGLFAVGSVVTLLLYFLSPNYSSEFEVAKSLLFALFSLAFVIVLLNREVRSMRTRKIL